MKLLKSVLLSGMVFLCSVVVAQTEQPDSVVQDSATTSKITYQYLDESAMFPGGELAMRKWLATHLSYPEDAKRDSISGVVYVQFVVEVDGSLNNITVRKGLHPSLDSVTVAIISQMPPWIPGKLQGKPARSMFVLPIQFQLNTHHKSAPKQRKKRR
jgi:periplasmic protein TonB